MPASKYKFLDPSSFDHAIGDADDGSKIGELRVKPSSVLWKGKGQHQYHSVSLDDFITWITQNGKLVDK